MNEICTNAKEYLGGLVTDLGFDLTVGAEWNDEGCLLNLVGEDSHFALAENGELLDAFEVLLFQVYGRQLDREHRFVVDAEGFRQTRKAELHAMPDLLQIRFARTEGHLPSAYSIPPNAGSST
ncbi:MAG: hypothetical protein IPG58_14750 [Acidobacteria bacterium]|nr:hypothetical protein [Acidobacteriota bacterium]